MTFARSDVPLTLVLALSVAVVTKAALFHLPTLPPALQGFGTPSAVTAPTPEPRAVLPYCPSPLSVGTEAGPVRAFQPCGDQTHDL